MTLVETIEKIKNNLSDDLLKKKYLWEGRRPLAGHCYVATECFYYLYGKDHGWKPMCKRFSYGETHWWLEKDGEILDITALQFKNSFSYKGGHKQFFMSYPSKRCLTLSERIKNENYRVC